MKTNDQLQATLAAEGYITVAAAADLLPGVRRAAIYGWIATDRVRHRRVGERLFVARADVRRVLGLKGRVNDEPRR